jgi:hypothetical protein
MLLLSEIICFAVSFELHLFDGKWKVEPEKIPIHVFVFRDIVQ